MAGPGIWAEVRCAVTWYFFFFQAEDGIRDLTVTGVQTCALPISMLVQSRGASLITDPWVVGSTYWRSWWNYPKASDAWRQVTDLDYVAITHMQIGRASCRERV